MSTNITEFSQSQNIRLYVIEHTIHIELLISELLGSLLKIDSTKSKALGFSSSSISFNQKVQIVEDFKAIDNTMRDKLKCLMNIRNKFAHVQYVDSFENLFSKTSNGNNLKNQLEKWYSLSKKKESDDKYKYLFFRLSEDITKMLFSLRIKYDLDFVEKEAKRELKDYQLKFLKIEVMNLNEGEKIIESTLERAISEYKKHREL